MSSSRYPFVIIGAGAVGAAAAYALSGRSQRVLVLEQFANGHTRGSSHGASRIIRHSYADSLYASLMPRAYVAWRALEADAGEPLYFRTGGISASPAGCDYADCVAESLRAIGLAYWAGTGAEWNARYAVFGLPADARVVFEPDVGVLSARNATAAMLRLAAENGALIRWNSPVVRLDLDCEIPRVLLGDDTIEAECLIVAAGAWVGKLIPTLASAFTPTRQRVLYLEAAQSRYGLGKLPVFIWMGTAAGDAYYGMPDPLGRGVKVARHGGPACDPDVEDREVPEEYVLKIRGFLRRSLPALADAAFLDTETCLYTMADAERFRVGWLPAHPRVLVASPCSGHGFKFAPLVGKLIADLATREPPCPEAATWALA